MKIQSALAALAALVSAPVFAHVELGAYLGTTPDGAECGIEIIREWHEGGLHHGLNHRVEIAADTIESITIGHPSIVDTAAGTVRYDHDRLVGTRGAHQSGVAVVMEMDHTPGNDGPKSLTILFDNYVNAAASTRWTCAGLRHVAR